MSAALVSRGAGSRGACGAINAMIVIFGRLQPIVTTIATSAIYYGAALALAAVPGGDVNAELVDALSGATGRGFPGEPALLLAWWR